MHDEPNLHAGVTINIDHLMVSCFSSGVQESQSGACAAVCVFISVVTFETMYICRLCDSVCAQVKFTILIGYMQHDTMTVQKFLKATKLCAGMTPQQLVAWQRKPQKPPWLQET